MPNSRTAARHRAKIAPSALMQQTLSWCLDVMLLRVYKWYDNIWHVLCTYVIMSYIVYCIHIYVYVDAHIRIYVHIHVYVQIMSTFMSIYTYILLYSSSKLRTYWLLLVQLNKYCLHQWVASWQKFLSVRIFDWDDTLLPTSWISQQAGRSNFLKSASQWSFFLGLEDDLQCLSKDKSCQGWLNGSGDLVDRPDEPWIKWAWYRVIWQMPRILDTVTYWPWRRWILYNFIHLKSRCSKPIAMDLTVDRSCATA